MNLSTVIFTGMVVFVSIMTLESMSAADLGIYIFYRGNILLSRNDSVTMPFTLEGKQMFIQTFGLGMSIIDFTLSRINTGEFLLKYFCDVFGMVEDTLIVDVAYLTNIKYAQVMTYSF